MQTEKGELGSKRKASISFPDAIQSCNALTHMELHTKSGFKKRKSIEVELEEAKDDTADSTLYNKESVGKIKYQGIGEIDICQLEFMSTDDIFDRLAIHEDDFPLFKKYAKLHMPNFDSEIDYYRMNGSEDLTPERGFIFNNDNKNYFVKYFLEKLIGLKIKRSDAYVRICKIEIKELYDPYINTFMEEENWKELRTIEDVNNLNFDFHQFYINGNEFAPLREEMEKNYKAYQDNLKENKKNKREQAKIKKENKLKESKQTNEN
jgi:hypothetical protein